MDSTLSPLPAPRRIADHSPLADRADLARELAAIKVKAGNTRDARSEVVQILKRRLTEARKLAEQRLIADSDGRSCAESLSLFQDDVIRVVYDWIVKALYPSDNPSSGEHMTVVATGGYGRGMLAPGSDIDLLFLLPYKQTAWGESVAEAILYCLWDMGLKVGHATRSVDECIRQARADQTIRTALLESRYILGDTKLFKELERRFDAEVVQGTVADFVAAKLAERDERHRKTGQSRYLVEPNVKDGKGGLRDLHTLFWIARYAYRVKTDEELAKKGVFTRREAQMFRRCEKFLWTVRCHLHFLTGRAEERLSFDLQRELAPRLGYRGHNGLVDVERFMKHYFLTAKDVGDLTAILCAELEERHEKPAPVLDRFIARLRPKSRRGFKESTDFQIDHDRITVSDDQAFARDPVNLIRIFALADRYNLALHPDAMRLLTRSLKLVDDKLRNDATANELFVAIVTSANTPEVVLRRMNEAGLLGRFVPEFGRVVAMMQFNMYHHYTVDEHLLRCIGTLQQIERGGDPSLGLAAELIQTVQPRNRDLLYITLFLHDIAKGRPEDHSVAGAKIARKLGPRFGLTKAETETVAWLVEEHLVMSTIAQSRDLSERKTIETFAGVVQSLERMKLLLILTTADIIAVGPGVWNGWKSQLLRTLYYETEPVVTGGFSEVNRSRRVEIAQEQFRKAAAEGLSDLPGPALESYIGRHYAAYWLKVDLATKIEHARFLMETEAAGRSLASRVDLVPGQGVTHLTVLAPDHPRLLSIIAGACAAAGANIVGAQIYTTTDGLALDTISITRGFDRDDDEERRAKRIADGIEKALRGEIKVGEAVAAVARKAGSRQRSRTFRIPTEVAINNTWSNRYTVIEVSGLDRPGLLHDLTAALSRHSLNIASAYVATFGEKAVDVFYVTDLMGAKIQTAQRQAAIRKVLISVLEDDR
ncbi:[protein-PII] uridylyltransferase [Phreatobacter aquaticus]|uniref:Bifunctional uridylyltransferase/uridylyl-removing enzyme n=1 Tax=Phreatobacter aquaticus TaxID=2570229 RepID=A0A4D7QKE7_9HYPH|nr:[protein-PII] uridylyltransferase [Phreatobacter aquaticus]QCK85834.1 [protein-PII] uridylyltransferase [Phreatobacter aquaticus]